MPGQNDSQILESLLSGIGGDSIDPRAKYLMEMMASPIGSSADPGQRQHQRDARAFAPFEIMRLLDPANQDIR